MCGIAGYKTSREIPPDVLPAMVGALVHRGPDAAGYHRMRGYAAGMRRLSINDLTGGDQPLYNHDRSVVLFYNGEIYNYPALRARLEARGVAFRTHSDGEVIAHLYDEVGEDVFEHLDGMFAAALFSEREQKLILARDLPGEKPLYYTTPSPTEIAFASELKSLRLFPGIDTSLDLQALWDMPTFLWVPEPDTAYRAIRALPRGHLLVADGAGVRVRPYANRFNREPLADPSEAGVVAETRRVVSEAVRSRLLSDVPIGCFLSGGLDSSIVTTLAARELGGAALSTFTVGFEDVDDPYHGRADESVVAEAYAKKLGTKHHTVRVLGGDFRDALETFCRYGDQPFGVSSGLGILAIARAARAVGIKVLLSGDGADETFGGYSWYSHLPAGLAAAPAHDADTSFQDVGVRLEARLAALRGYTPAKRAWAWHYYASEREKQELFAPRVAEAAASSLRWFDGFTPAGGAGAAWTAEDYVKQDREFYFPFEMLRKCDRMTMAHSVEGRVPFAAPAVLAHADKLRYRDLVRGDTLKWALRRAFADVLPEEIVERPKHGFNVPIDHWLRGEWSDLVDGAFAPSSALTKHGLIHAGSGAVARRMLADERRLNGHTILCFIMMNMWLEQSHAGTSA